MTADIDLALMALSIQSEGCKLCTPPINHSRGNLQGGSKQKNQLLLPIALINTLLFLLCPFFVLSSLNLLFCSCFGTPFTHYSYMLMLK